MSLENAFQTLRRAMARLLETVSALHVAVAEDKPTRGDVILVEQLDGLATDVSGAFEEADAHVVRALRASQQNSPLQPIRAELRDAHAAILRGAGVVTSRLSAHDPMAQLLQMGRERGREWREWSQEVKTLVDRCAALLPDVTAALMECWNELADRMARFSMSVQSSSIGQQFNRHDEDPALAGHPA
ncbi:MAG: hypothetical protein RL153_494 [Verrucomicrobiota bacterium]|jgi:hypothetical protein